MSEERKGFMIGALPWWQALIFVALCAVPMYMGLQSKSMSGTLCSIFFLAVIFNELGERLPIWNDYIGGGLLMCFFGVALMNRLASIAAQALADWDCEIVETHHRHKVDAPSGTALTLAKTISEARQRPSHILYERQSRRAARDTDDIGISSLRGGSVAGEHQILWFGDQERLEIKHVAENRAIFANGALKITRWLAGKPAGLYDMSQFVQDIVGA